MKNWKEITDKWELLENAPEFAESTAGLISWSHNYNAGDTSNPIIAFLAIIGYYDEVMDFHTTEISRTGYLEMSYLANALTEYCERPNDVWNFVELYFELEHKE